MSFSGIEALYPRPPARRQVRCEYCRRASAATHGNCEGCGAPLPGPAYADDLVIPQPRAVKA